jgi:hypothetical protein
MRGGVAEWFKAAVLKTVEPKGSGGSNPSSSANPRPEPGDRLGAMTLGEYKGVPGLPDDAPDPEQMRLFSAVTPNERWAVARSLYRTARDVKRAGVRAEHPDWSEEQVLGEVRRQFLRA